MTETKLIDYLKGVLSNDECDKVEDWYNQSVENKKKLEDLYFLLFVSDRIDATKHIDIEKSFLEFKQKLHSKTFTKRTSKIKRFSAVAAVYIGLLVLSSVVTLYFANKHTQQFIVSTQLGERAKVTLPDKTTVWLNACSSIKYSKSFLSNKRNVELSGEGFFEVTSKNRSSFIVSNKSSQIEVLGTKFNVKCNDDESFISASLFEGSILFNEEQAALKLILKPGEEVLYDRDNNNYSIRLINSEEDIVGWREGKIIFTNASLEEIAKKLERHYNVKILFANPEIKVERFNADFEASDNIYQIISMLGATKKFTYSFNKNNREITISSIKKQ